MSNPSLSNPAGDLESRNDAENYAAREARRVAQQQGLGLSKEAAQKEERVRSAEDQAQWTTDTATARGDKAAEQRDLPVHPNPTRANRSFPQGSTSEN
jgi:ribosome recycling factor